MSALIFITADQCRVLILNTLIECFIVAQSLAHIGQAFCVPAGVLS